MTVTRTSGSYVVTLQNIGPNIQDTGTNIYLTLSQYIRDYANFPSAQGQSLFQTLSQPEGGANEDSNSRLYLCICITLCVHAVVHISQAYLGG